MASPESERCQCLGHFHPLPQQLLGRLVLKKSFTKESLPQLHQGETPPTSPLGSWVGGTAWSLRRWPAAGCLLVPRLLPQIAPYRCCVLLLAGASHLHCCWGLARQAQAPRAPALLLGSSALLIILPDPQAGELLLHESVQTSRALGAAKELDATWTRTPE